MDKVQYDLSKRVVFITGAATGIGRATAVEFARSGANVVVVDINENEAHETMNKIETMGSAKALFIKCDTSKDSDVKAAVDKTVQTFGRLDIAFNNAGVEGEHALTADTTEENWDRVMNINLKGVWHCMKYQIPVMLKQKGGSIVNCASIAGVVGFMGSPAYVASKHGVIGLTKTAALEYAKMNIRINAICPGIIQTPMIDRFVKGSDANLKALEAGEPIGRVGQPEEIASAALWLGSSQSSFVTGHSLVVDGGWVAQ